MPTSTNPSLQRGASEPLSQQLAQRYAERIRQRLLLPGVRMPSVRECAKHHSVSPHTVVAAYDQLQAAGLLEARSQRGFFVREAAEPARHPAPQLAPRAPLDATSLIKGMFAADPARSPGLGLLPPDWLDAGLLQSGVRAMSTGGADVHFGYGDPAGELRLREALTRRLADVGVPAAPSQILTTLGASGALDLATRGLLPPGSTVLVDDPGWGIEFARLAHNGMRALPVPRQLDGGPDLAVMAQLCAEHKPAAYVTVSVLHNPTGASLNLASCHQLLMLADKFDLLIVEDDTYALLAADHQPRLSALDGLRRTVYISGFSKILSPAWRVGFLAASPERIARMTDLKLLSQLTTPPPLERAVAHCLERGRLRRHAEQVRQRLDAARLRVARLVEGAGCRFAAPPAGLFGWVDVGVDTERLAQPLHDAGWLTAPGALFSAQRRPGSLMRVNFATSQDASFWAALRQAATNLR
jgi:DNA-binding transcriptional MocR family regulator